MRPNYGTRGPIRWISLFTVLLWVASCLNGTPKLRPELQDAASQQDGLALFDNLEKLIDEGRAKDCDREDAYETIRRWKKPTAEYSFARAGLAGRLAQIKGLSATSLVTEVERYALQSYKLNPRFRDGAAKRVLGLLYVLAPGGLVNHGDSETGLEMLEEMVEQYPDEPINHLWLARGYIALGDPDPAKPHLCICLGQKALLRRDFQRSLAKLVAEVGGQKQLECQ